MKERAIRLKDSLFLLKTKSISRIIRIFVRRLRKATEHYECGTNSQKIFDSSPRNKNREGDPNEMDVDEVELVLPVPSTNESKAGVSYGVPNRVSNEVSNIKIRKFANYIRIISYICSAKLRTDDEY